MSDLKFASEIKLYHHAVLTLCSQVIGQFYNIRASFPVLNLSLFASIDCDDLPENHCSPHLSKPSYLDLCWTFSVLFSFSHAVVFLTMQDAQGWKPDSVPPCGSSLGYRKTSREVMLPLYETCLSLLFSKMRRLYFPIQTKLKGPIRQGKGINRTWF